MRQSPQMPPIRDLVRSALGARSFIPLWAAVGTIVASIGVLLFSLLYLSADAVDRISYARERSLVEHVVSQSVKDVSHHQESVTVWDDAILQLRTDTLDHEWLDNNLGVWLHEFFGLDEAYVLTPRGRSIHAMQDGKRVDPGRYRLIQREVGPLVRRLREKQLAQPAEPVPEGELTVGVTEVTNLGGRPAVLSIKPIVTDSGGIPQEAGTEFMHVAVRRLDGPFLKQLGEDYLFSGARFSGTAQRGTDEAAFPWRSSTGEVVGYFIWKPFRPGSRFLERTSPLILGAFLLIALVTGLLVRKVHTGRRQLQISQERAQHLAFHDALTGLPNRALFEERFKRALAVFQRDPSRQAALLYIDLDRFKKVNDSLGHPAGDKLIRELGARMAGLIRAGDTIARLGGDEFAIIQTDVRSSAETETLCERLIEAAQKPFILPGGEAFVGVSIGVAFAGADGSDARELARKADIALYESKGRGRCCYTIFRDELMQPTQKRETRERDLRDALEDGDAIAVHYQPFFSSETGSISGVEALVRWDHPVRGAISPATFVPTAEESGLIHRLGDRVLREACLAARRWDIPRLCVNVSPVQLCSPHFGLQVLEILQETGLAPGKLELEVPEAALLGQAGECQPNMRLLRLSGVKFALDDFGAGSTPLRSLSGLEVDRIKIDRSIVHEIGSAASADSLIRSIVDFAQAAGLKTTAEGIETTEQRAFLQKIGCHDLQGFMLATPMTVDQLEEMLRNLPGGRFESSSDRQPPLDAERATASDRKRALR